MPPTYTVGGLALKKPAAIDPALIADLNTNADLVDAGTSRVANVKGAAYGAVGDGVADDRAAILLAEAALGAGGGTLFFAAGTYKTAANLSLLTTTNLLFHGGATLAPATGTTITIGGTVRAGLHQIFSGVGLIKFTRSQTLHPEWWGATTPVKTRSSGGAMTSGSAILATGGDPAFAATDVGKIAVVLGAGAAGAPLVTTVSGFTNGSTVTLAANAGTTVTQSRWAVGTDQTAAVQACLVASSGAVICPVLLSDLYGISSVKLRSNQILAGNNTLELVGFVRLASSSSPAVSLDTGVSGDTMRLTNFVVNCMYFGALDGIEIGTAAANLALANAIFENILVRNAGGIAFNLRVNGLVFRHLISKQDQAPPAANTTAKAARFIDTLVYGFVLGATGNYPAGVYELAAGGGSVYVGVEGETAGTFGSADQVTLNANGVRIVGLYLHHAGTCRDLVRIPTGFVNHRVDHFFAGAGATCTNVINDVDRSYTMAGASPIGDVSIPEYHNLVRWAQATVTTLETTTSTSYTNLATSGPAVSISPVIPTDQAIEVSADMSNSAAGICLMSPALSGTGAQDTDSCTVQGTSQSTASRRVFASNQATGATHTAKYRVTSGTGSFSNRRISVEVVRP